MRIRDAFAPADESGDDLPRHGQHPCDPDLASHTKIENTVRYLGVDVEDALLLAERTNLN